MEDALPDREEVQYRLLSQLPQASWVGVRVEGTRVVVTVVEKRRRIRPGNKTAMPDPCIWLPPKTH